MLRYYGTLFTFAILALAIWLLDLQGIVRASVEQGHLLDWVMGALCLLWLVVILKVPWDLYFQAHTVNFDLQRSQERGVATVPGREEYVRKLRTRLGWLAVGMHVGSAALVAGITFFTKGAVGNYFAVFYLISTLFRPAAAGYVYLSEKLRAIGEEARYPREDIMALRVKVESNDATLRHLQTQVEELQESLAHEKEAREAETRELRHSIHSVGREFETTVSRLTDNQDIIKGIQSFVRLVAQSTSSQSSQ